MMPPRRRNLQRAFGPFLPLHIAQIAATNLGHHLARLGRAQHRLIGVMAQNLVQRRRTQHLRRPDPSRLGPAGLGAQQHLILLRRAHRRRQRANHRNKPPIQRQFPQCDGALHLILRDDLQRGHERQRNRQVEMAALFRQVSGRQVHRNPLGWQRNRQRVHRRTHPLFRLAHRLVGQSHKVKRRHPRRQRALHFDQPRLDPFECHRKGPRDHFAPAPMVNG